MSAMSEDAVPRDGQMRVGEIVEASTSEFTAECYRLYDSPSLGSLVRTGDDRPIYGIICEVTTRSMDPARRPIARGLEEDTEADVYLSNPQLNRLLRTEFRSLVVGHQEGGSVVRHLAPLPPRIHSFVYRPGDEELRAFSSSLEFMPILLAAPISAHDDVISSFLQQASASHPNPRQFLVAAGKEMAVLMSGQMQRLNNVLRRLSP